MFILSFDFLFLFAEFIVSIVVGVAVQKIAQTSLETEFQEIWTFIRYSNWTIRPIIRSNVILRCKLYLTTFTLIQNQEVEKT
jgi:hypothetical protein